MNFVGVGYVPPVIILIIVFGGAALYLLYLCGLSRLLTKAGFPQKYAACAVILDAVLVVMGIQPWLWHRLFHPPIPVSAFCALMLLAFVNWPQATVEKPAPD